MKILLSTTLFVGTFLIIPEASAQQRNPPQLEEVIVTAQKREETLRDVPISVAALSDYALETLFTGSEDIMALSSRVPGLYAESSNGRAAPRFYIRGLGNSDFDLAASQPVSIVFDDVVQENVVLKSFPIFDVNQVEVVRGPQGTLFGRNTTAGVIKFESRKPTFDSEGYAKTSIGRYGTANLETAFGGALVEDKLAARLSILSQNRDDWVDNSYTNEYGVMGGLNELAGRLQFLYTPADTFSALLNMHARDYEGTATLFRANALKPGVKGELVDNFKRDEVYFNQGDNNPQAYKNSGASLNLNWKLDTLTINSITAYETAKGSSLGDIDGGVAGVGPGFIPFDAVTEDRADVDQITQEVRIASETSSALQWQTGVFYFDANLDVTSIDGYFGATTVTHENMSYSVFGQMSYDFTNVLTLTGGLRYTYDEKSLTVGAQNVDGFALVTGDATIQNYDDIDIDDDQVSWELSLNYLVTDFSSLYGRVASGFRAQSIQGRDVAFEGAPSIADSETIDSIELGYKADLVDDSLRLNAAIYYYEISDLQLTAVGGAGNFNALLNAEKGVGQGIEFDLQWVASEYAIFTLGGSYNDTEIQDEGLTTVACGSGQCTVTDPTVIINGSTVANINGNQFQSSPETVFNFTARLSYPVNNNAEMFLYTDWAYQGKTQIALYEALEYEVNNQYEGGLKIGYQDYEARYQIAIFGRNITDEENIKGQIDFNNLTAFVNEPAIYGLEGKYEF